MGFDVEWTDIVNFNLEDRIEFINDRVGEAGASVMASVKNPGGTDAVSHAVVVDGIVRDSDNGVWKVLMRDPNGGLSFEKSAENFLASDLFTGKLGIFHKVNP